MGSGTPREPLIKLRVGPHRQEIWFLVDSGAERTTVQQLLRGCSLSDDAMMVIGAKGEPFKVPIIKDVEIETETKKCIEICY